MASTVQKLLNAAGYRSNLDDLKGLIEDGIDVNSQGDILGDTSLMWASSFNKLPVIRYLIEQGAEPNGCDKDGWTALHYAARRNSSQAIPLLLGAGANPKLRNNDGKTALDVAMESDQANAIVALTSLEKEKPRVPVKAKPMPTTVTASGRVRPAYTARAKAAGPCSSCVELKKANALMKKQCAVMQGKVAKHKRVAQAAAARAMTAARQAKRARQQAAAMPDRGAGTGDSVNVAERMLDVAKRAAKAEREKQLALEANMELHKQLLELRILLKNAAGLRAAAVQASVDAAMQVIDSASSAGSPARGKRQRPDDDSDNDSDDDA